MKKYTVILLFVLKQMPYYFMHLDPDDSVPMIVSYLIKGPSNTLRSVFGKRDLLAIFILVKKDVKCATCLHKFDCREIVFQLYKT